MVIRGQGPARTQWLYNNDTYEAESSRWLQCANATCSIGLENLAVASGRHSEDDRQVYMANGGALHMKNVLFDGENYNTINVKSGTPL